MATTTATFTFSEDITDANLSLSNVSTLTQAGTTTGLDTILRGTKTLTSLTDVDLINTAAMVTTFAADVSTKVYIANTNNSEVDFFTISIGAADGTREEVGRLYGGDWMFIPWGVDDDITIKPSTATAMTVEYMVLS